MTTIVSARDRMLRAKDASRTIGLLTDAEKQTALRAIADAIDAGAPEIVAANAEDLVRGRESGLTTGLLDRLALDETRVAALASAVRDIALLPDPVGRVLDERTLPSGVALTKVAVPFGVTSLAQISALASLDAEDELQERVDALIAERERVVAALTEAGWSLPATQTNFLWFPLGDSTAAAMEVFDAHGLLVRGFPGEGLRATIAESEANDRILAVAAELVERGLAGR